MALFNRTILLVSLCVFMGSGPAWAHGSFPGSEGFVRGLAHPVSEPLQGLLAGTFGVLLARTRTDTPLPALIIYWVSVLLAGLAAFIRPELSLASVLLLFVTLAVSVSIAGFKAVPFRLNLILGLLCGLAAGINAISMIGEGRLPTSLGSVFAAILFPIYLFGPANWLVEQEAKHAWLHLVPRVLAAWVVAVSIMMLAFYYAQTGPV